MSALVDIATISRMLAERIDSLVPDILPNCRQEGNEWVGPPLHGTSSRSLSVHRSGAKAGTWCDFAAHIPGARDGHAGDALGLVAYALFSGDIRRAIGWSRDWLGIGSGRPPAATAAPSRNPATAAARRRQENEARRKSAAALWHQCRLLTADCPAWQYLASRGLDLAQLGRVPGALRWHDAVYHGPTGYSGPALIAGMTLGSALVAVQRIWVKPDGSGKMDLGTDDHGRPRKVKMALGDVTGASVKLWRGATNLPVRRAPPDDDVILCEGVEDGLAIALLRPDKRVLVAISLSNMANVQLPGQIRSVTLAADNDDGAAAQKLFARAVEAHQRAGRQVRIARPAVGKDFNDWLLAAARPEPEQKKRLG